MKGMQLGQTYLASRDKMLQFLVLLTPLNNNKHQGSLEIYLIEIDLHLLENLI